MEGLQELTNALLNGTIPIPYGLPFPKIGGSQPQPKIAIAIISGTGKVKIRTSNLAGTFTGSIRTKAHEKMGEKGAWAYPGTAQIFGVPLLSQECVKLRNSNFVRTFIGSIETKAH